MSRVKLHLIAAACENMGIGANGSLPWRLNLDLLEHGSNDLLSLARKEMAFFTTMTTKVKDPNKINAVIMGRRTWECIPDKYRPLVGRVNIVLTRNIDSLQGKVPEGVTVVSGLDEAVAYIDGREDIESTWVIGGSSVYKAAMEHKNCGKIYLTEIQQTFECDTFFPPLDHLEYTQVSEDDVPKDKQIEGDINYYFRVYKKL